MNTTTRNGIAIGFLIAVWAFLVYVGKAEAPSLVETIKAAILFLSGHTIFKGDPKP